MKGIVPWCGWLLFAGLGVNFASHYGTQWEFGRHWMPKALLAPDGCHYADGEEIDPVSGAIARSGKEEEGFLAVVILVVGLVSFAAWKMIRRYRKEREAVQRSKSSLV